MWDFEKLYQEHWAFICRLISARFGSGPPDPKDVAQDAFMRLSDQLKDGVQVANPRAFLAKTAHNLVIDYHRSPKNREAKDSELANQDSDKATDVCSPENVLMSKQALGILEEVLMTLSERDRAFVLMNRLDGLSYTEIARRANMSRSGVQLIITQALQKCLDKLRKANAEQ